MATYNFCTLFDSNYLSRGIAMYHSLKRHCDSFHLYVFAFDDKAYEILNNLSYEHITIISLKQFENEQLLSVKSTRSRAEYCWTCTPYTILHVLNNYKVDNCTYIDADLFFYSSPKVLFDEMGDRSVLITEHRFTPKYDRSKISGKYCVQFMVFKNNEDGLKVLNWWANACFDWCYDRYEDGKFGDQKYLDDWTTRFNGIVHELQYLGGGMAPWNIQQYEIKEDKPKLTLKTKQDNKTFDAVFFHFHYVRFYENDLVDLGWMKLDKQIVNVIYVNYLKQLDKALDVVKNIEPLFEEKLRPFSFSNADNIKEKLKILFKKITRYNLFDKEQLMNRY
jgi:hypothetical protein